MRTTVIGENGTFQEPGISSPIGLLTSVRGDFAGVNLNANYTWSHCISDRVNFSNFGRITSVQEPRIMQFALKYVF